MPGSTAVSGHHGLQRERRATLGVSEHAFGCAAAPVRVLFCHGLCAIYFGRVCLACVSYLLTYLLGVRKHSEWTAIFPKQKRE